MKKGRKFAILVDERGKEKLYLKKLISLLREDYGFLKEECRITREKIITKAKTGDLIVFGTHKKFDYTTVSNREFREDYSSLDVYALQEEFAKVKQQLKKYIRDRKGYVIDRCFDDNVVYYEESPFDFFVVDIPKKVKKPKRIKKSKDLQLEEVRVHHNYVQVGWDNFTIYEDAHGDEFVEIDGNVYWVERNNMGKGWLTIA